MSALNFEPKAENAPPPQKKKNPKKGPLLPYSAHFKGLRVAGLDDFKRVVVDLIMYTRVRTFVSQAFM